MKKDTSSYKQFKKISTSEDRTGYKIENRKECKLQQSQVLKIETGNIAKQADGSVLSHLETQL